MPRRARIINPGDRFERLITLRRNGKNKWLCRCICGIKINVTPGNLRSGNTRSCGCLLREWSQVGQVKHGLCRSREYKIWCSIKQRCTNFAHKAWKDYGGRGITLCSEWLNSFEAFYAHVGPAPGSQFQIDRINNNCGYEPGNVRWATRKEQTRNSRGNILISYAGATRTIAEWAEVLNVSPYTLYSRVKRKLPPGQVLSTNGRYGRVITRAAMEVA